MKIMVTGHRPNKLWGYNLNDPHYIELGKRIRKVLIENNCTEAITGMALGVDTIFALEVIKLKEEGHNIKLTAAIPCKGQYSRWPLTSQITYRDILKKADRIVLVSDSEYSPSVMQKRNRYMVDNSDLALIVWNGSPGGTCNCVNYICLRDRNYITINPVNIENYLDSK